MQIGLENGNGEAKYVSELMSEGMTIDAAQTSKLVNSVITDSLSKKGDITNVIRSIAAIEGRDADYYTSRKAIDTARAVMDFVRGEGNARTNAIIENSRGARGVVLALSENKTAWDSVKREAGILRGGA